jgi:hypothetical protein
MPGQRMPLTPDLDLHTVHTLDPTTIPNTEKDGLVENLIVLVAVHTVQQMTTLLWGPLEPLLPQSPHSPLPLKAIVLRLFDQLSILMAVVSIMAEPVLVQVLVSSGDTTAHTTSVRNSVEIRLTREQSWCQHVEPYSPPLTRATLQ